MAKRRADVFGTWHCNMLLSDITSHNRTICARSKARVQFFLHIHKKYLSFAVVGTCVAAWRTRGVHVTLWRAFPLRRRSSVVAVFNYISHCYIIVSICPLRHQHLPYFRRIQCTKII